MSMGLAFPESPELMMSHNQSCFPKKSVAVVRLIPSDFRCFAYNLWGLGLEERHRGLIELSQVDGGIPLQPGGSGEPSGMEM